MRMNENDETDTSSDTHESRSRFGNVEHNRAATWSDSPGEIVKIMKERHTEATETERSVVPERPKGTRLIGHC